jgi:predicted dehydrogenase
LIAEEKTMSRSVKLAVLGAGLIGKRHIEHVQAEPEAELMAIVDPSPTGKALAQELGSAGLQASLP